MTANTVPTTARLTGGLLTSGPRRNPGTQRKGHPGMTACSFGLKASLRPQGLPAAGSARAGTPTGELSPLTSATLTTNRLRHYGQKGPPGGDLAHVRLARGAGRQRQLVEQGRRLPDSRRAREQGQAEQDVAARSG